MSTISRISLRINVTLPAAYAQQVWGNDGRTSQRTSTEIHIRHWLGATSSTSIACRAGKLRLRLTVGAMVNKIST